MAAALQPFADAAPRYASLGLRPLPVGLNKRPSVKGWKRFGTSTYESLLDRFAGHNIGALNGKSPLPIAVVDIDDLAERAWCEKRFGDTPVKVQTPSGGEHWFYHGHVSRRIRFEDRKVDILGAGGYCVLPPSHTPDGDYRFLTGAPEDFRSLPALDLGEAQHQTPRTPQEMREGDGRNKVLFDSLRAAAPAMETFEKLLAEALFRNTEFAQPMSEAEVTRIAKSVWGYLERGELMLPGCESRTFFTATQVDKFLACPDAMTLLAKVRQMHGHKGGAPFELPKATGPKIMGWGVDRYLRARNYLFEIEELIPVKRGKQGSRQPTVVRFPVSFRGAA